MRVELRNISLESTLDSRFLYVIMAASGSPTPSSKAGKPRISRLWRSVGFVIIIGAAYWYQEKYLGGAEVFEQAGGASRTESAESAAATESGREETIPDKEPVSKIEAGDGESANGYERLEGVHVVEHRNNDGDSFWVRHGDREFELRLYFADTAEKYLSDRYEDQRRRVGDQARDFGGISVEQTVELGKAAKMYVERLLDGKSFVVYTRWERVYEGERFYAWVDLPGQEGEFLNERLVDKGLARIHTKGAPSPDGRTSRQYESHLERLESAAREADRGAWGLD